MATLESIRREEFAAAIAIALQQPKWRLSRDGWYSGTNVKLITRATANKTGLFEQFCRAMNFIKSLEHVERTANPTTSITSRDLKTHYEVVCRRLNLPGHTYACNGAFILAAIATGLADQRPHRELSSSCLKLSRRAWKLLTKPVLEDNE